MAQQTTKLALEVLSNTNVWTDITSALQKATINVGFPGPRLVSGQIGRGQLRLVNTSGSYGVDLNGNGSSLLRPRRRIRLKAMGKSLKKALQVQHTGNSGGSTGTTATVSANASNNGTLGDNGTSDTRKAQSFLATLTGQLTQFTFALGANSGTPTGGLTYEIHADTGTATLGTILTSGTVPSPNVSGTNTVSVSNGPVLVAGTLYWLVLYTTNVQSTGNAYKWSGITAAYSGIAAYGYGSGSVSPYPFGEGRNFACAFTVGAINAGYFSQVVTQSIANSDVWTFQFDARSTFDSQYNAYKVRLVTSAENGAFSSFTFDNKWLTYTITFTATATATTIAPQLWDQNNGTPGNAAVVEFRNMSLRKGAGANILTNGDLSSGAVSPWTATNISGASVVLAVIDDYWIVYNAFIEKVTPAVAANGAAPITIVDCVDWLNILNTQTINLPLQKVQRADQLNVTALTTLPTGTLNTTLPGIQQDTGLGTFQRAFDGYVADQTLLNQALADAALSEYGMWWMDRDGTFRFVARDYKARRVTSSVKLSVQDGQPVLINPVQDGMYIINRVKIKYTPRSTTANVTLAMLQSSVAIPPISNGVNGQTTITLTFRDPSSGRVIGGDSVINPRPVTDFKISDNSVYANKSFDYTVNIPGQGGDNSLPAPTFVVSASQIDCTFYNPYIGTLYVNTLQVIGTGVYTWDPVTYTLQDNTLVAADMINLWTANLPFTDDNVFVAALGYYLVNRYKNPFLEVTQLQIDFQTSLNGVDLLGIEIGDVIAVTDAKSGLSTTKHVVVGVNYVFDTIAGDAAVSSIVFILERLDDLTYGIWNDPVYGLYDSTARFFI